MTGKQDPIIPILVKYALKQELSDEEQRLLDEWRSRSDLHEDMPDQLRDPAWRDAHQREIEEAPSAEMWKNIQQYIRKSRETEAGSEPQAERFGWGRMTAAAIVLVLIGGVWWYLRDRAGDAAPVRKALFAAAAGASTNVEMTLANGRVIHPEAARPGELIGRDGQAEIFRTYTGIRYSAVGETGSEATTHSISIGRGIGRGLAGSFTIMFPDGSKVSLDTNTRFAYSVQLKSGPEPVVEGQAFFEIAHNDPAHPLRVWTGNGESMTVLGTAFNVRSYADEPEGKVELYSGKLRVNRKRDSILLEPNSMAVMGKGQGLALRKMGRHGEVPDWMHSPVKSPYFEFQNTPLPIALREVADWYGKSVIVTNGVDGVPITGKLPHSETLEHTLNALQQVQGRNALLRIRTDTIILSPGNPGVQDSIVH